MQRNGVTLLDMSDDLAPKPTDEEAPTPAPDTPAEPVEAVESAADAVPTPVPQITLTFLLVSGRRRTQSFDPETTVGRVKELVWNAWPSEWQDERPPAPAFLRILYLGKILQDEDTLAKLGLPSYTASPTDETPPPPPTIVHLAIRMHNPAADDSIKKKKSRRRQTSASEGAGASAADTNDDAAGGGGCCCVVC
ncbi:Ubiquitin-like domain-containing protein [Mycena kentingensis (nom. inval.)]|nr:Ubiquitin-like domain-containing protein [Mycena kentingensis (nom. inval.)]